MFKKILFVAAFAIASSPAFVSAQDFFFSFDEFSRQSTLTVDPPSIGGPITGQVFIFGDADLDFNQLDLDFTVDDSSVAQFTNGTAADSDGSFTAFSVENPNIAGAPITPTDGRLFAASVFAPGVVAGDTSDAEFREGADGFLLAQVDFDVLGGGTTNFDFSLGSNGVGLIDFSNPGNDFQPLDPSFGSAALTVLGEPAPTPVDPPAPTPVDPPTPTPVDPPTPTPVDPPTPPPVPTPVPTPVPPPVDPPAPPTGDGPSFFFSFDEFSRQSSLTLADPAAGGASTSQLFIFGDENLDFNQLDLDFTNSDSSVVQFTGATIADSDGSFTAFSAEDPNVVGAPITPTDGRLFALSIPIVGPVDGQDPALSGSDAEFRAGADGFLLATIDLDIIGTGTADFDFILGDLGVVNDGVGPVDVDFTGGQGILTVGDPTPTPEPTPGPEPTPVVPEPSSTILLILGAAGMVARRKRS